ncbi:MAG: trigger factor [Selenomonadaceae bacterium]|nr:trigger factor [Selenomonadaceae bacterium]
MKIAKEILDNYEVELTVELDADQHAKAKKTAAKNLANRVSIPGFRKGKAPLEVIESHVGKQSVLDETAEILIQQGATQALKDENLTPVNEIDYDVITNEDGKDFVFKMKFTPYPKVELGEYKNLNVEKTVEEVTDADVDKQLEVLRDHHAVMTDAEPDDAAADGDFITLDFEGYIDGEKFEGGTGKSHPLTLGSGRFIPGFEDQLVGGKVDQDIDVNVKFPEDYHDKKYAGKDATFKCKILSIKHRQLPELNDEFAQKASTFKTLDEFKENIRRNMVDAANRAAIERQQEELIAKAADNIKVDIPPVMIEDQIDKMIREQELQLQASGITMEQYFQMTGHEMDEMRESMRESAEHAVRISLMLEAVAEAEKITVDQKDYRYEVAMLAATYNIPPKEIQKIIRKENQGSLLVSNALRRKVVSFLIANNIVKPEAPADEEATDKPADEKE